MRTREALQALIEGRLASPAGRSELVALATRQIVEEAIAERIRPGQRDDRAAERWRSIRITEFERRQMAALRQELNHDYEATVGLDAPRSKPAPATRMPSGSRT